MTYKEDQDQTSLTPKNPQAGHNFPTKPHQFA